ncbi:MAG TPA: YciI family protein [Sphingomicrobium sp.]|jgi:hypothetical protein|nr:YciI family protein [Sphingomicrobium sp.]
MGEFAFVFRGRDRTRPAQLQRELLERWAAWMKELDQQGRLTNPGQPLDDSGRLVIGRGRMITDGPFAEAKDLVNGFIVIAAVDLDEAVEIAKACPIFEDDGSVEVRPVLQMRSDGDR